MPENIYAEALWPKELIDGNFVRELESHIKLLWRGIWKIPGKRDRP